MGRTVICCVSLEVEPRNRTQYDTTRYRTYGPLAASRPMSHVPIPPFVSRHSNESLCSCVMAAHNAPLLPPPTEHAQAVVMAP